MLKRMVCVMMAACAVVLSASAACAAPRAGACGPGWETGYVVPGIDGSVRAVVMWDDGTGPALYIGGEFAFAGGVRANHVVKWTEAGGFEAMGQGLASSTAAMFGQPYVASMAVFDDGAGSALYVTGTFDRAGGQVVPGVARWTGETWEALDMTGWPTVVRAGLALAGDDGAGDALFLTASIVEPSGTAGTAVLRWRGGSPAEALDAPGPVVAMTIHDNGSGPSLYAATTVRGLWPDLDRGRVHRRAGSSWETLPGVFEPYPISALASFDDGSGSALYVAGSFYRIDGALVQGVARWRNEAWENASAVSGVQPSAYPGMFFVWDSGASRSLLLSGSPVLRWNGSAWQSMGAPGTQTEGRLAAYPVNGASTLVDVRRTLEDPLARVRTWRDGAWAPVRNESFSGMTDGPGSLMMFRGAKQPHAVLFGAGLRGPGTGWLPGLMHWDGTAWSGVPLSGGFVKSLSRTRNDARTGGDLLWVCGSFDSIAGVTTIGIASFDGVDWGSPGGGLAFVNASLNEIEARATAVFDDGSGPALYVGGRFSQPSWLQDQRNHIARWDGSAWTAVGRGLNAAVNAMAVYDDGGGARLIVGGEFSNAGGVPIAKLASWDGSAWRAVGGGVGGNVLTLKVAAQGVSPALYVGGTFTNVGAGEGYGPVLARNIARWDGQAWSALGTGINVGVLGAGSVVRDMVIEPEPAAPLGYVVYVGGAFRVAGATPTTGIARWDGRGWKSVGGGLGDITSSVTAMAIGDDPTFAGQRRLYVGGSFSSVQGTMSTRFASYRLCSSYCPADANGDLVIDFLDLNHVLSGFGQASTPSLPLAGDLNGDGVVDFLDLNVVLSAFGTGC